MSSNTSENSGEVLAESGERPTSIRVLFIRDKLPKRILTIDVGTDFKEIDIVYLVCAQAQTFKEILGLQMINESLLRVTAIHNSVYVLEVKSPMLRMSIQLTTSNSAQYQYVLEIESPTTRSFEFDKFSELLNTDRYSDLILCVDDKHVPAHKAVLANRSPVFDALLTNETQRLQLTDITSHTLVDLLSFIYKGHTSDDDCTLDVFSKYSNLLKADAKYFVNFLKELCEEKLCLCINVDNVLECLILADSYNAFNLKESAIKFFTQNRKRIVQLPIYENFVALNPYILCQILKIVALEE